MTEWVSSMLLVGLVFCVIPIVALVVSILYRKYVQYRVASTQHWLWMGNEWGFYSVVVPIFIPLLWFVSSVLHVNEMVFFYGKHSSACVFDSTTVWWMRDETALLFVSIVGILSVFFYILRVHRNVLEGLSIVQDHEQEQRIQRLLQNMQLRKTPRYICVQNTWRSIGVVGVVAPKIVVHTDWSRTVDDDILQAALYHEVVHIEKNDVLRYVLLQYVLGIPLWNRILRRPIALWVQARESFVDRCAVELGANALDLAQSLVQALRWQKKMSLQIENDHIATVGLSGKIGLSGKVGLSGNSVEITSDSLLRLRMELLFSPQPLQTNNRLSILVLLVAIAVLLAPHLLPWDLFERMHHSVEHHSWLAHLL